MGVEHSRVVVPAARTLLTAIADHVYEPLAEWVSDLPPHALAFIDSACSALRNHALACAVRVPAPALFSLLEVVLSADRDDVGALVLPLSRTLADRRVMSGFAGAAYQEKLSATACWMCTGLPRVSQTIYRAQMRALTLLAHNENICWVLFRHAAGFPAFVVGHLTESEPQVMHLNWGFFRGWTGHTKVLVELLKSPVAKELAGIVSSDSNLVLKEFFQWAINLWRTGGPTIVALFCEIMMPTIGRVTGMFRLRRSMFKGDERLVQLIEDYAKSIAEVSVPGAEKFIEAFGKHMDSKDVPTRGLGWIRFRQNTQRLLSAAIEKELL
jgi:hypothetical protein